jgi:hypothetical protein
MFETGLPASGWTLAELNTGDTVAINVFYDRDLAS